MQKNALTRLTSLYLCLMLTVFLLWPGTSGYAQIAEAKYRLFLWLTGGYCALSVLLEGGEADVSVSARGRWLA